MEQKLPLSEGTFVFGANYWVSHAGTRMWSDWDESVVEDDFRRFKENGLLYHLLAVGIL